ncbi:sugar ABC transporter substrate-binding protein [Conexibacter woesei]|uniref:ABC-type sugar transport system periplasmic component-like protein n=1 Tax=Conexibacter woesei (strain DSM 14684 / CCUG 47730 / CIP 108061 / JCM 11494 / NBRC 100937 / ID131577) TaxID=469383 RepID=D3F6L9_CONWI|nr:substrate-binding domain-containing protein [Conexibacter woesei]ADB50786.1 ABC-type sugar transport system periplasmic component-like protein [Conexibacter woesei DSM 14684]
MTSKVRAGFLAALVAAVAVPLAGCGSSGDGDGDKGGGTTTAAADVSPRLRADVEEMTTRPTSIGIDVPIERAIPRDKEIYYIQCGSPVCATNGDYLVEAAEAVGWEVRRVNAGVTPESVKSAWLQAVRAKPDGVVASGFPRSLFNSELLALEEAGVPVVDISVTDPPGDGISAVFAGRPQFEAAGEQLAEYALVEAGGKDLDVAIVRVAAFPVVQVVGDAFAATIRAACTSCKIDFLDIPATSIGNDLPTRLSTYLQGHPDVNWVYNGFADMSVGVPAALQSAGIGDRVKILNTNNNPTTAGYMASGQDVVALHIYGYPELMWRSIDFFIRDLNGESTAPSTKPTFPDWVVTKETVPSTTELFPAVADYAAQYKRLWGVE